MKLNDLIKELQDIRMKLLPEFSNPDVKIVGMVNDHEIEVTTFTVEYSSQITATNVEDGLYIKLEEYV